MARKPIVWGQPLLDEMEATAARPAPSPPFCDPARKPAAPVSDTDHITYYWDLIQGSDEWLAVRCGLLTASEMKLIMTPKTLKAAANDKEKTHLYELLAQRVTGYVEPRYISDDMLRGKDDEVIGRALYAERIAPVTQVGFVTNNRWGFMIGYSPDGLVGDDGLIECKSRRQYFQMKTWVENVTDGTIPEDFLLQVQTGMLVTERSWNDLVSVCGGLPLAVIRAHADPRIQDAIVEVSTAFEKRLAIKLEQYRRAVETAAHAIPTERRVEEEMFI